MKLLELWFPDDLRLCVEWFAVGARYKQAEVVQVINAARMIGNAGGDLVQDVRDPVLQKLVKDLYACFKNQTALEGDKT